MNLDVKKELSPEPFWDLLLLADPARNMVEAYLEDGILYNATWEDTTVGVFVLCMIDEAKIELKNIAVAPEWQGKGVGKALLEQAVEAARALGYKILEVGTGNSSIRQIEFYQRGGFRMDRIAKNYFTLNYDEPIVEDGIQCKDMVFLQMNL